MDPSSSPSIGPRQGAPAAVEAPSRGPLDWAATLLFTLTSNVFLVVGTVVLGSLATAVGWIPPRGDWTVRVAKLWSRLLLLASGVRLSVDVEARLDPRGGFVFMANHQSMIDVAALLFSVPGQARFLAKRSLFRIPFFGPGLRAAGFVPVDRHDRDRAAETFAVALDQLRTGRSLILFPEETRSSDGQLLPFKRGGVLLAVRTGHPVIPIGLRGTGRVRRKGSLWTRPGRVRVRYGRPIPTRGAGAAGRRELAAQVRAEVARLAFDD